ncbi:hypothetical protein H072_472 [Dactylellina haptotyla CBS 200.50]|uniref:ATP-dependent RNA helicase n=1 Tax=Dactylellina haptotyla (strain CBS 200.50) TaxID=1284197 RepID=S8CD25_DACHA|nr:hypothetical protein H072_472 [Dactylellina haptotyla CBS 200.50]
MAVVMQSFNFCQWSPEIKSKRQYTRKTSWDSIREFVSKEVKRGVPHPSIIAKLAEQGQPIERNQFKRLLKRWGLSDRNLRKKHRKYIYEAEQKARREGVRLRWRFKDTGQSLKKTQLKRIRESNGAEFIDSEASPGQLIKSPTDALGESNGDLEIASNVESRRENDYSIENFLPNLSPATMDLDTFIKSSERTEGLEVEKYYSLDGEVHHNSPIIHLNNPIDSNFQHVQQERPEKMPYTDDSKYRENFGENAEDADFQTSAIDPTDFLQTFCADMLDSIEASSDPQPEIQGPDVLDSLESRELVHYLSYIFRPDLERWMTQQVDSAKAYLQAVDNLQHGKNISRQESEKALELTMEMDIEPTITSYEGALYFTNDRYIQLNSKVQSICTELYEEYYKLIPYLWKAIGSDIPTFESIAREIVFNEDDRQIFREVVVHLPYLEKSYGAAHFATTTAVFHATNIIMKYKDYLAMLSSIRAVAPRRLASATAIARSLSRFQTVRQVQQPSASLVIRNSQPSFRTFATTTLLRQQAAEATEEAAPAPVDAPAKAGPLSQFSQLKDIGINEKIVNTITNKLKYEDMTDVQIKTIPTCNTGADVIARAKTGTGKTLAFLIPTVNRLMAAGIKKPTVPNFLDGYRSFADVRALIISPTRELAEQITRDAVVLTRGTGLEVACMVGGTGKSWSLRDFHQRGCNILVATPGRLKDVLSDPKSGVNADAIQTLIFDEADSLMSMGFEKEIEEIRRMLPKQKQTLMFSATMPDKVRELIAANMRPGFKYINTVDPKEAETHTKVPQHLINVEEFENVHPTLFELLDRENREAQQNGTHFKAMVFFNTARGAELAALMFRRVRLPGKEGHPLFPLDLVQIHSRLTQARRTEAAAAFRKADDAVLFSSDVTARGMDFPNVTHVIQVGAPSSREQYIHRIGRTARGKNIESGKGAGYLILSDVDARQTLQELRGIKLIHDGNEDLVTPKANLADLDTLNERAADYAKAIVLACSRIEPATTRAAYSALLGAHMARGADPRALFKALYRMGKFNFGWEEPPKLGREFVKKIGMGAGFDYAIKNGYLVEGSDSDRSGRSAGTSFSTRSMGMSNRGSYDGPRQTSFGRNTPRREGGYNSRREGGYESKREGGYSRDRPTSFGNRGRGEGGDNNQRGGSYSNYSSRQRDEKPSRPWEKSGGQTRDRY